ncbi:MAG: hypothetical protein PWQ50_38 [Methanolobus sp.]|jgi:hypothetical protein|nr:hypothetical protein [Methanolobus sp.]
MKDKNMKRFVAEDAVFHNLGRYLVMEEDQWRFLVYFSQQ